MATGWPDSIDEILLGDDVVVLGYLTPASGAVLTPVTNFAVRNRRAGTFTVNSSIGAWKKLERLRRRPQIAIAFHTRAHGRSSRPEFVLLQGTASLSEPTPDDPATIPEHWEPVERWRDLHPLWKRWLRVYATRVSIEIAIERLVVWPDLSCRGEPHVHGEPLPRHPPEPQRPPRGGTAPRINHRRAAGRARRLPEILLGWAGADLYPVILPVDVREPSQDGILLEAPPELLPPGGRRAGLTAHRFDRHAMGQDQRIHTGWLEFDPASERTLYAPHTAATYRFPESTAVFHLVAGGGTRWRLWRARRAGELPDRLSGEIPAS